MVYDRALSAGEVHVAGRPAAGRRRSRQRRPRRPTIALDERSQRRLTGNELATAPLWASRAFVDGIIAGMALDLDGVDDYVDCGNSELSGSHGPMPSLLSVWINWRAPERRRCPRRLSLHREMTMPGSTGIPRRRYSVPMRTSGSRPQGATVGMAGGKNGHLQVPLDEWHQPGRQPRLTRSTDAQDRICDGMSWKRTNPDHVGPGELPLDDYPVIHRSRTLVAEQDGSGTGSVDEVDDLPSRPCRPVRSCSCPARADVTAAGDAVQGVPNDGDWPGAETPDLAIDDNVSTKYLHFKGDFDPDAGPTGIQVTPVGWCRRW